MRVRVRARVWGGWVPEEGRPGGQEERVEFQGGEGGAGVQ